VGYGEESPADLLAHPLNFRVHSHAQKEAMRGALSAIGVTQNAVVSKRTGRILDGHMRVEMAVESGQPKYPVTYVDLTEEEERAALATFDALGSMAVTDADVLGNLMSGVDDFGNDALDSLLSSMMQESFGTTIQDVSTDEEDDENQPAKYGGDKSAKIRPVIYAPQVAVFEKALRATGQINRGTALMQVCQFFLDNHAERQFDSTLENLFAH